MVNEDEHAVKAKDTAVKESPMKLKAEVKMVIFRKDGTIEDKGWQEIQ